MVFEYMDADLTGVLASAAQLSVAHIKCLLKQVLESLAALHSRSIMHRDVKGAPLGLSVARCSLTLHIVQHPIC